MSRALHSLVFGVQDAQDYSHVSLKLVQKILDLVAGSRGPRELSKWTGIPIWLKDVVQFKEDILDISQGTVFELVSQTSSRRIVAFKELREALP